MSLLFAVADLFAVLFCRCCDCCVCLLLLILCFAIVFADVAIALVLGAVVFVFSPVHSNKMSTSSMSQNIHSIFPVSLRKA